METTSFFQHEQQGSLAFSLEESEFLNRSMDQPFDDHVLDDLFDLVEDGMEETEGGVAYDVVSEIYPEPVSSVDCSLPNINCLRPQPTPSPQPSDDWMNQTYHQVLQDKDNTEGKLCAPLMEGIGGFVNVYLMVDPSTDTVWVPRQIVQCRIGDKIETEEFGPFPLPAFDKKAIADFTKHVIMQQAPQNSVQNSTLMNEADFRPDTSSSLSSALPYASMERAVSPETVISSAISISSSKSAKFSEPGPLKALSAYNFFFRDERERILNGGDNEYDLTHQEKLLQAHWNRDRNQKRRHRKSHGKISFTTLSRLISQRWKQLDETRKDFYREIASKDWQRYQHELQECKGHFENRLDSRFPLSLIG